VRLLYVTALSPQYVQAFYASHPGLEEQPYDIQRSALMADHHGWADSWTVALRPLGYETADVVCNVRPLQRAWAREHGLANGENPLSVFGAQVIAFDPEILFINDATLLHGEFLRILRSVRSSIRRVVTWCGAPVLESVQLSETDLLLSPIPELVERFSREGLRVQHLHHSFDPRVLHVIDLYREPNVPFSFIGSVVNRPGFHVSRQELLVHMLEMTDLQVWAHVDSRPRRRAAQYARQLAYDVMAGARRAGVPETVLKGLPLLGRAAQWSARPWGPHRVDPLIVQRSRGALYGIAMFQKLHDSRVTLNTHLDASVGSASNMRLYEATGVGACLLTDWKANLKELFEPDVEVVVYRDSLECVAKYRELIADEPRRRRIAQAGQRRAMRDHTVAHRAEQLHELLLDA
jgi:hypothetical protein